MSTRQVIVSWFVALVALVCGVASLWGGFALLDEASTVTPAPTCIPTATVTPTVSPEELRQVPSPMVVFEEIMERLGGEAIVYPAFWIEVDGESVPYPAYWVRDTDEVYFLCAVGEELYTVEFGYGEDGWALVDAWLVD